MSADRYYRGGCQSLWGGCTFLLDVCASALPSLAFRPFPNPPAPSALIILKLTFPTNSPLPRHTMHLHPLHLPRRRAPRRFRRPPRQRRGHLHHPRKYHGRHSFHRLDATPPRYDIWPELEDGKGSGRRRTWKGRIIVTGYFHGEVAGGSQVE